MINGREVQNLLAGEPFISYQFQTHNVRRVEVMMGPASALYGANAFVGVINVVTKLEDPAIANAGSSSRRRGRGRRCPRASVSSTRASCSPSTAR